MRENKKNKKQKQKQKQKTKQKQKRNKKGEIIRSSFLESSTFLVSSPVGISRQNVSLQLTNKLAIKSIFPLTPRVSST